MSEQGVPPVIQKTPLAVARKQIDNDARKELLFRIVISVLLVVSLFLAWWSFTRVLVPRQKLSRELTTKVSRLSEEVDQLDRNWPPPEIAAVSNSFNRARQSLFTGPSALESWWNTVKQQAVPLVLDVKVNFDTLNMQTTNGDRLAIIPARLDLEVDPPPTFWGTNSPYQRVLRLAQQLAAVERRADLTDLSVIGGTNSVTRASVGVKLWAAEEELK